MPSVRFSRDKRGYEYVYLVHTPIRRGKPGRSRVLYWYRTPPGVRIGRKPFDPDVQKLIEQQNPGLTFDWNAIVNTPMPPPDMTEYWRERRRAEKAARQERRAMESEEGAPTAAAEAESAQTESAEAGTDAESSGEGGPQEVTLVGGGDADVAAPAGTAEEGTANRKRRRRRGGRKRRPDAQPSDTEGSAVASPADGGDGEGEDEGPDPSESADPTSEEG